MTDDFSVLGTAPCFVRCLEERNIRKATDIQKKVIPRLAAGESVFFSSATGTGKTFAYLLPLLGHLLEQDTQSGGKAGDHFFLNIRRLPDVSLFKTPRKTGRSSQYGEIICHLTFYLSSPV